MAKLRKMLGRADDPEVEALMRLIETQSRETLAAWAADCVEARYLPIYEKAFPGDARPRALLACTRAFLNGTAETAAWKAERKAARDIPKEAEGAPAAQAAVRAILTACAVYQTPTSALGFTFYGAAAAAYEAAGLDAEAAVYDGRAADEFRALAEELRRVMRPDEPHPARINWNC